jgi:hypothetical protein
VIDEWSAVSARDLDLAGKLLGGAILDPLLIGDDGPITTVLYWEVNGPSLQHQLEGTWRCDATTCMQVLSARNLVPDPGFEWKSSPPHHADSISKATSLVQATWKADLYPQADSAWFLTQARRSGFETTVSCLDNTAHTETAKVRTGITARISDVEPDALYLQIGWLETDGRSTNGLMGRMWLLPDSKQVWDYMVAGPQHTEWRSYGQIVRAAEDSTSGKLLLQNYNSGGKICFDDLIFIQLGR